MGRDNHLLPGGEDLLMWSWGDLGYTLLKATAMVMVQITRILLVHVHEVRRNCALVLLNVPSKGRGCLLCWGFAWYEGHVLQLDALHHSAADSPFPYGHVVSHVGNLRT